MREIEIQPKYAPLSFCVYSKNQPTYAAVYKIINTENGNEYVGCTNKIHKRITVHISRLKNNNHESKRMQLDYNKNKDCFIVEIIHKTKSEKVRFFGHKTNEKLRKKETEIIKNTSPYYNTLHTKQHSISVLEAKRKERAINILTNNIQLS